MRVNQRNYVSILRLERRINGAEACDNKLASRLGPEDWEEKAEQRQHSLEKCAAPGICLIREAADC